MVVALGAMLLMKVWEKVPALKKLKVLPGPLVAVVCGVLLNEAFAAAGSGLAISREHLVNLPVGEGAGHFFAQFTLPDFGGFANQKVWTYGLTIAVVASSLHVHVHRLRRRIGPFSFRIEVMPRVGYRLTAGG